MSALAAAAAAAAAAAHSFTSLQTQWIPNPGIKEGKQRKENGWQLKTGA